MELSDLNYRYIGILTPLELILNAAGLLVMLCYLLAGRGFRAHKGVEDIIFRYLACSALAYAALGSLRSIVLLNTGFSIIPAFCSSRIILRILPVCFIRS